MSLRRNARLRREYLYRKGLEGKESDLYEKKRRVKVILFKIIFVPFSQFSSTI
jgi:U3 small nucleolar ribonucleoprotein protein IMP4